MDVVEGRYWVVRVAQVPNVDDWVLVVIVCDQELKRNFRVPEHLSLSRLRGRGLVGLIAKVAHAVLVGLHELED